MEKSLTILTIGDPHFQVDNPRETEELHEKVVQLIKEESPDHVIILGDTLHTHERIHVSPLTRAVKFIYSLASLVPVTLLIGNHDLKNDQQFLSDEHPFYALRECRLPVRVADHALRFTVTGKMTSSDPLCLDFVAVPYVSKGRFEEALNTTKGGIDGITAIFAHQEFMGAQLGAHTSTEGDIWSENNPLVISGHIHDYQELPGVVYVGTPIQQRFGEALSKTVSLWTWTQRPDTPGDLQLAHRKIDLGCRKKKIVRLTAEEVMMYVPPHSDCPLELKIKVSGTAAEIAAALKHHNVKSLRAMGHKVVPGTTAIVGDCSPNVLNGPSVGFSAALKSEVEVYAPKYPKLNHWFDQLCSSS
jgi:predicted phosphodiesterase